MHVKTFADTNVHVYAHSSSKDPKDIEKRNTALQMLDECYLVISTQVIREFTSVMIGNKGKQSIDETEIHVENMIDIAESVIEEDLELIRTAFKIHKEYIYGFYDSLIISAALRGNCDVLLSEDMQHEQMIEERLTIINPFFKC